MSEPLVQTIENHIDEEIKNEIKVEDLKDLTNNMKSLNKEVKTEEVKEEPKKKEKRKKDKTRNDFDFQSFFFFINI